MSFEFVHVTRSRPHQDAAAAKRVRAQAMRNFRRRQDEERARAQAGISTRTSISSTENPTTSTSTSNSPDTQEDDQVLQMDDAEFLAVQQTIDTFRFWILSNRHQQHLHLFNTIANDSWRFSTSPILFYALCLEAMGHLEAIYGPSSSFTELQRIKFKLAFLRLAVRTISMPDTLWQVETLAALACLTIYEISCGSTEAVIHLRGIRSLREKALENHSSTSSLVVMFLEIVDLLHALTLGMTPVYTTGFNIMRTGSGSAEDPSESLNTWMELRARFEVGDAHFEPTPREHLQRIDTARFDEWRRCLLEEMTIAASYQNNATVTELGTLAADLVLIASHQPSRPSACVQKQSGHLYQALSNAQNLDWSSVGLFYIRVLLTALALSDSHRSWYFACLTRALYQESLEDWPQIKGVFFEAINIKNSFCARSLAKTKISE